jgi:hypothetical protein
MITISILIIAIPTFLYLSSIRTGSEASLDLSNYFNQIGNFLYEESYYQKYMDIFNSFAPNLSFFEMLFRWITLPLPLLPNVDFPILSYAFTDYIIGIDFGDPGYYIVLPGAFGEGLMMLGRSWVWIYGAFIGLFVGFVFNMLKSVPHLKYYLLYFFIDYSRAFRGGIQTFIESTYNTSLLLIFVVIFLSLINKKDFQ